MKRFCRFPMAIAAFLTFSLFQTSCADNADNIAEGISIDSDRIVEFVPYIKGQLVSRAGSSSDNDFTEFYVNAWSGLFSKGRDVRIYLSNGAWVSDVSINWPAGTTAISFWALNRPFANGGEISGSQMTRNVQKFTYTLNPEEPKDLMYASRLKTNYEQAQGKVAMNFMYSLAYPSLTCRIGTSNEYVVAISEVIFHNLKTSGTFEFSKEYNSDGTWTVLDTEYGTFRKVLNTPVILKHEANDTVHLGGSWILMPQKVTKWKTKSSSPVTIAEADEKHQCYVELKCKIIKEGGIYTWGHPKGQEDEYESVYVPFGTSFNKQGYNNEIRLTFTGGFNADGTLFTGREGIAFAPWVTEDIIVEPWEELPEEDLEFNETN